MRQREWASGGQRPGGACRPCDVSQVNHLFSQHRSREPNSASDLKSHLDTVVLRQKKGVGVTLPKGKRPLSLYSQTGDERAKGGMGAPEESGCP